MATLVALPDPLPVMDYTEEFIREYEVIYYTILKGDRVTKKLTKLLYFKSFTPTTEVAEQDVPLYSEMTARKVQTSVDKSFGSDGYLTRDKVAQEFINIVDKSLLSDADTAYPIYRVLIYRPLDAPNVYLAHSYTTNVTVSHIAPDDRLMAYNVVFNVRGDMTEVAVDIADEAVA